MFPEAKGHLSDVIFVYSAIAAVKERTPAHFGEQGFCGAADRIRTDDLRITSALLCQLSHSSNIYILS